MKFIFILLLIPLSSLAADRLINPSEESRPSEYNESGWNTNTMNPWTRQIPMGCQGENCPEAFLRKMADNSSKIYDFLLTVNGMNSHEIAYRFGYSEKSDPTQFRNAVFIIDEVKESIKRSEPKKNYIQSQLNYVRSSEDIGFRQIKAELIGDMVFRLNYAKRKQ